MSRSHAWARASANIALAKYWGKADLTHNIPAVPSISLTLRELVTETEVCFDAALPDDSVTLDGRVATAKESARVRACLDRIRAHAGIDTPARVASRNHFPTAAGLASSASGFAALVVAAARAAGLDASAATASAWARQCSASAARSLFGGFVELPAGQAGQSELAAQPLLPEDAWEVRVVVAVLAETPKAVGSTEGMERSRQSSPLYAPWLQLAPELTKRIREGILARDLTEVGPAMEQSTLSFHAAAMTAEPPLLYWLPESVTVLQALWRWRAVEGLQGWATMDAGPQVKVLCLAADAPEVAARLAKLGCVRQTLVTSPGPGVCSGDGAAPWQRAKAAR
ncbi:MAG: diphosphomevalonate decarboxylase [Polyangiales bacterium]